MNFDPKATKLHNQEEVDEYLAKYGIHLSPGIEVEFCSQGTDFALPPPNGGVYMHSQILELRLKLSLTKFARGILSHYRVASSQLSGVAWYTVLGFKALYSLSVPEACLHEVFCAAYALRKTSQDTCYFLP